MTLTIPRADIDNLKAKIDLVELIGQSVKLNRAGTWMTGCCPFHKESNPSFAVKDNRYQCFGCDAHVFGWLVIDQGLDAEKNCGRFLSWRRASPMIIASI